MATTNNHDELLAFATRVLDRLSLKISNHSLATGEMMTLIKRYGQTQVMEAIVAMLDMTQASIGNFGAYLTSALKGGWDLAEKAKAQKLPLQVPHGLVKTQSLLESQNLSFGKLIEKDDKTLTSWQ